MSGEGDRKGPKNEKNPYADKFGVSTLRQRSKRTKPPIETDSEDKESRKVVMIAAAIDPKSAAQGSPPSPWASGPQRPIDRSALPSAMGPGGDSKKGGGGPPKRPDPRSPSNFAAWLGLGLMITGIIGVAGMRFLFPEPSEVGGAGPVAPAVTLPPPRPAPAPAPLPEPPRAQATAESADPAPVAVGDSVHVPLVPLVPLAPPEPPAVAPKAVPTAVAAVRPAPVQVPAKPAFKPPFELPSERARD